VAEQDSDLLKINEDDNIDEMFLTFGIQDEEYAVNITHVTEIVGIQKISEVPDVPAFIKGVINLRGKVIPVMDVRLRFGLPWREYDDRTTIIVLELNGAPTGLMVDRVNDVTAIPEGQIDPPPRWRNNGTQGVIKGLGKQDNRVSVILDVGRLLYE
jgi:purine-binding chemotaxis protein CheW